MNRRLPYVLALTSLLAIACDKPTPGPDKTGPTSADTKLVGAKAPEAPPPAPAAPVEPTLEQFLAKTSPATCKMIDACKNDKAKAVITTSVMLVAAFGSMDKPDLQKQVSGIDKAMKADKRWLPNEGECTTIGNVALSALGLDAAALKDKIGKTVAYDGKKAAACLAAISAAPDACKTEVKLTSEPKFSQIEAFEKELKEPLDAFSKPCEEVVTGLVDTDGACELDVECKGKGTKCKAGKKDPKAKVCQPKK